MNAGAPTLALGDDSVSGYCHATAWQAVGMGQSLKVVSAEARKRRLKKRRRDGSIGDEVGLMIREPIVDSRTPIRSPIPPLRTSGQLADALRFCQVAITETRFAVSFEGTQLIVRDGVNAVDGTAVNCLLDDFTLVTALLVDPCRSKVILHTKCATRHFSAAAAANAPSLIHKRELR
eukprot:CAMPEP_0115848878 /NCGR_PEP_ID=MMETSP0287-20121206/11157_1 /TAXON_ID=412157 /ORGANISM="Chrysochromulina rotalis, Strain UIO044" /LENGTH=176 /DNA_ID=CAMNT_0003302821 /DNA_START=537 /DNA_END=1069 /DNA_ORIENTATION=+